MPVQLTVTHVQQPHIPVVQPIVRPPPHPVARPVIAAHQIIFAININQTPLLPIPNVNKHIVLHAGLGTNCKKQPQPERDAQYNTTPVSRSPHAMDWTARV